MKYDNTAKFTFDYTWRDSNGNLVSRTRNTTTEETLGEILNAFELFLRGSGFYFDGHLEFVNDNNESCSVNYGETNHLDFNEKQMEFDFIKDLMTSGEDIDKDTDIDLDDKPNS